MKDIPLLHTVPIVLLAVKKLSSNQVNVTTIGDIAIAGIKPPLLMISLHKNHYSRACIDRHGLFSINLPTEDMLSKVDYCGSHSGSNVDKSQVFSVSWVNSVPIIKKAPISMICKTIKKVMVEHRVIYIVDLIKTIKNCDSLNSINGIQYGLDNLYYSTGHPIGRGYEEANHFKKHAN